MSKLKSGDIVFVECVVIEALSGPDHVGVRVRSHLNESGFDERGAPLMVSPVYVHHRYPPANADQSLRVGDQIVVNFNNLQPSLGVVTRIETRLENVKNDKNDSSVYHIAYLSGAPMCATTRDRLRLATLRDYALVAERAERIDTLLRRVKRARDESASGENSLAKELSLLL